MGVTLNISRKRSGPQEHLLFSEHMTEATFDSPIRQTFLGQAHIAGTGPEGTTCRECVWWQLIGHRRVAGGGHEEVTKPAAYFGKRHKQTPCELKKQRCTKPILNKANRLIPHHAKSCRLFEANPSAPAAKAVEQ